MSPRVHAQCKPKMSAHQKGSMLVIALFIIVVLSILVGSLSKVLTSSSESVIYEVYGVRAQQAAKAGLQALAQLALPLNSNPVDCNQNITSPPSYANIDGVTGCSYVAICSTQDISFNGDSFKYFWFTSTGSCQVGEQIVSRTLSADAFQEQ